MKEIIFFDQISIGRKFQTPNKIIYQKISNQESIPLLTPENKIITNKKKTIAFYNTKIPLTIV